MFPGGLKGLFPFSISVFAVTFLQLLFQAALCLRFGFFEFTWTVHLFFPIRKPSRLIQQPSAMLQWADAGTQGLWAPREWEQRAEPFPEHQLCSEPINQPPSPSPCGIEPKHFPSYPTLDFANLPMSVSRFLGLSNAFELGLNYREKILCKTYFGWNYLFPLSETALFYTPFQSEHLVAGFWRALLFCRL